VFRGKLGHIRGPLALWLVGAVVGGRFAVEGWFGGDCVVGVGIRGKAERG
jgi:hypothetical protein